MYYVYILHSSKDGMLYIGYTHDLRNRLHKHYTGFVRSTKHRRPLQLIHYEAFLNEVDAKRRELFLKGGKGHDEMRIVLKGAFYSLRYKYRDAQDVL